MACKFKQDGNPRWCTTIQGECQFLTADDGPKCPVYNAFPEGWTRVDPDDPPGPPTPPLPYDAEVEYLESTGTQWIDTGIESSAAIILQSRFAFSASNTQRYIPFAYYIKRGQQYGLSVQDGNIVAALISEFTIGCSADVLDWHDIQFNMSGGHPTLHFDGVHIATATNEYVATGGNTIYLYASRRSQDDPGLAYLGVGKIASFSITDATTGQKIQDLIPVRKNGVGYMYDRVSGQLLGNSGTGEFVLGPDL